MNWEQFFNRINEGEFAAVYCLSGAEEYVKKSALLALREKILPVGLEVMNETILEGASAQQIIEAAETLPMMCDRRLVLVRDWAPLLSGKARNEAQDAELLSAWLPKAPQSCCLVFYVHGMPDGRKKAMQALAKNADCVNFELLSDEKIMKWVSGQLKPHEKKMDGRAVEALVFMAGRELTRLTAELEKLVAYAKDREAISAKDVETLVAPTLECTVFQMIDMLMGGDRVGAQRLYKSMLEAGESRVGVLAMLTRQLRNLTHIRLLKAEGMRMNEIEKQLGLNHYGASRTGYQADRFSLEGLEEGYRACLNAEFDIKSGKLKDTFALDHVMFTLGEMH